MPVWTHYFAHFVVAVIATISFGITFQMPRRHYLACGLTGAVGWMVYIFGVELFALSPAIATLVATLPLTGCARFFAIRHKAPVTIFLLPGIFPLVPGAGIYYTAYYFLQGEEVLFASKGAETFKVALALALGIALVCSLPLPGICAATSSECEPRSATTVSSRIPGCRSTSFCIASTKYVIPLRSSVTFCETKSITRLPSGRRARRRASFLSEGRNVRVSMALGMFVTRCPVMSALCLASPSSQRLHVTKCMLLAW